MPDRKTLARARKGKRDRVNRTTQPYPALEMPTTNYRPSIGNHVGSPAECLVEVPAEEATVIPPIEGSIDRADQKLPKVWLAIENVSTPTVCRLYCKVSPHDWKHYSVFLG
jgi:hypothetical protein